LMALSKAGILTKVPKGLLKLGKSKPAGKLGERKPGAPAGVSISISRFPSDLGEVLERYTINRWGADVEYAVVRRGAVKMYMVNEPQLTPDEQVALSHALEDIVFVDVHGRDFVSVIRSLLEEYGVSAGGSQALIYYLMRQLHYGPLTPAVLDNRNLEDVLVNSFERIRSSDDSEESSANGSVMQVRVVHRKYGNIPTNITITREELDKVIADTVSKAGRMITARDPLVDVMTPHGRFAAIYGGEVTRYPALSFRLSTPEPMAVTDLIRNGSVSSLIVAYLWLLQDYKRPIVVMGGIGTGKTTFSRAMLQLIPPWSRVIVIEDTPELMIPHDNWLHLFVRRSGSVEIGYERLLREALRHKSDYILVGEIRSAEDTAGWLNALAVGSGGLTTMHASAVLPRLRAMGVDPFLLGLVKAGVFITVLPGGRRVVARVTEIWGGEESEGEPRWSETPLFTYSNGEWSPSGVDEAVRASKNLAEISGFFGVDVAAELRRRLEFLERHRGDGYWQLWDALNSEWWRER